jgi:hypothetical protein
MPALLTTSNGLSYSAPMDLLISFIVLDRLPRTGNLTAVEGLAAVWAPERLDLIKRGEADPNEGELRQWRQAKCCKLADGSDWCWIA